MREEGEGYKKYIIFLLQFGNNHKNVFKFNVFSFIIATKEIHLCEVVLNYNIEYTFVFENCTIKNKKPHFIESDATIRKRNFREYKTGKIEKGY